MGDTRKPRMLIISFSPIASDARVLKQIELFRGDWELTACAYGPAPSGVDKYIEIPPESASLSLDGRLITLKQYKLAYWRNPIVMAAWHLLKPYKRQFDVVFADEPDTVPIALRLKPKWGAHVDLHEYTPSLQEHRPEWKSRIGPYFEWLIDTYASKADSWTSPSDGVSRKYAEMFGFMPETVTNAAPLQSLDPGPVGNSLRFVHHGGAQSNRSPEVMVEGFANSKVDGTFDIFLTGIEPRVRDDLRVLAQKDSRITVHEGIPYKDLFRKLNKFDVGIYNLPASSYNHMWALPNKLYDNAQARLGQIISPNPEMKKVVNAYDIGMVTEGYTADDLTAALDAVTREDVERWKSNAHKHARELSSESQVETWRAAVERIKSRGEGQD